MKAFRAKSLRLLKREPYPTAVWAAKMMNAYFLDEW